MPVRTDPVDTQARYPEEGCTILVKELPENIDAEILYQYFSRYGNCRVSLAIDGLNNSCGFAYVDFDLSRDARQVLASAPHFVQRTRVKMEPWHKGDQNNEPVLPQNMERKKMFVGGLPPAMVERELREFFEAYGPLAECYIIYDATLKRSRGFGFVAFEDDGIADYFCGQHFITIQGKKVECRFAQPKDNPNALVNSEYRVMGASQPAPAERRRTRAIDHLSASESVTAPGTATLSNTVPAVSAVTTSPPSVVVQDTSLPLKDSSVVQSEMVQVAKDTTPSPLPKMTSKINRVAVSEADIESVQTTEDALSLMVRFYHLLNMFLLKASPLLPIVHIMPPEFRQEQVPAFNPQMHVQPVEQMMPCHPPSPQIIAHNGPDLSFNLPIMHSPGPFFLASSPVGSPTPAPQFVFY